LTTTTTVEVDNNDNNATTTVEVDDNDDNGYTSGVEPQLYGG
jgi:hypothetical protein